MSSDNTKIEINSEHIAPIFSVFLALMGIVFLMMWLSVSLSAVKDDLRRSNTEIRLLQMQVQDQTAVMIREGIVTHKDLITGPTNSGKVTK